MRLSSSIGRGILLSNRAFCCWSAPHFSTSQEKQQDFMNV